MLNNNTVKLKLKTAFGDLYLKISKVWGVKVGDKSCID